nr:MAG TPA: hypothetical protein [Caudoviricetes sp.]
MVILLITKFLASHITSRTRPRTYRRTHAYTRTHARA